MKLHVQLIKFAPIIVIIIMIMKKNCFFWIIFPSWQHTRFIVEPLPNDCGISTEIRLVQYKHEIQFQQVKYFS